MLVKCPCVGCKWFTNEEGLGWEDTHNSFHVVYCLDGKVRGIESIKDGCCDFNSKET